MNKHPLEDLSERFIRTSTFRPQTIKSYRIAFKYYILYLKKHDIVFATTSDVIRYKENRKSLGYSSSYIHIHMAALRGLYRYLRLNQKVLNLATEYAYDIMIPIKSENVHYHLKKPILTLNQARHFIECTKMNRRLISHYRDHAIIYLMITSGLRSFEIIHAKRSDYHILDGKGVIMIHHSKGHQTSAVKLSKGAKDALDDYLKMRTDDNPYLFISSKQTTALGHLSRTFFMGMFKKLLKRSGLEDTMITPHALRHCAAYFNLLRGGSIDQTRALMRHQDLQSTLVYQDYLLRLNDDQEEKIDAFILKEEGLDLLIILE